MFCKMVIDKEIERDIVIDDKEVAKDDKGINDGAIPNVDGTNKRKKVG